MTNDRHDRGGPSWTHRSTTSLAEAAGASSSPRSQAPREALDREESLIRDAVLRMGALVEAAIREASRALVGARRRPRPRGHQGRRDHQRGPARRLAPHLGDDRHAAAGRARPALPADARPRHLRARADGRPRGVGRQGRSSSSPRSRRSRATSTCPRWPSGPPSWSTASCGRSSSPTRSRPARSRSRTTRSTGSTTRRSTRSSS